MIKYLKYFVEAFVIYTFFLFGKLVGLRLSQGIFSFIFKKIGPFFKKKKIILKNLEKFPNQISHQDKQKIIKNMWSNYGKTFIEYIFLKKFRYQDNYVVLENEKILNKILIDKKPVIFVSGHFANFEIMSMEIVKKGIDLAAIYRPLNNIFLNPLMEFLRKKYVCANQIKKGRGGVREAMNYIKKGTSVALMIDQRVSEGEKIELFKHLAYTTTLPSQLALKYNLSIVPVFIKRSENNNFKLTFWSPIKSSDFKDKYQLTKKLNEELEKMIILNPSQWIWTHERWK